MGSLLNLSMLYIEVQIFLHLNEFYYFYVDKTSMQTITISEYLDDWLKVQMLIGIIFSLKYFQSGVSTACNFCDFISWVLYF
jgi:hypothetical protein